MKYYFVSDIHGDYDKLVEALNTKNFNPSVDTLVTVGDLFDRGFKSKQVLEFVMSCPNRICIMGNHDARLRLLILRKDRPDYYDNTNGVRETFFSLCDLPKIPSIYWGLEVLQSDENCRATRNLLWQYFDECQWFVEFSDLIVTHGWLPCFMKYDYQENKDRLMVASTWRTIDDDDWYEAVWANTEQAMQHKAYPSKNMIVGHWHAWRMAQKYGHEKREDGVNCNCDSYVFTMNNGKTITFIDGCTNYPHGGKVNVIVYESGEKPTMRHAYSHGA